MKWFWYGLAVFSLVINLAGELPALNYRKEQEQRRQQTATVSRLTAIATRFTALPSPSVTPTCTFTPTPRGTATFTPTVTPSSARTR